MLQIIFLGMVLFHIIDDFCLQSFWLVNGKQKSWWEKNAPESLYEYDYLIALYIHSLSWAIMIMIPWFLYAGERLGDSPAITTTVILNAVIHALVDDHKANRHTINLVADQTIHLLQLIATCMLGGMLWYQV